MGKLIAYQEKKMTLPAREFVVDTLDQVQIAEISDYERIKQIGMFVIFQVEAFKLDVNLTDFDKKEIKELILMEFKRLSLDELYYAFKLERYGKYNEPTPSYGRFDAIFVAQVLKKYKKWKMEIRKAHNLPIGKVQQKTEPTEEEKKELILNGVMECYDFYKEYYYIEDGKTYVYDVLYDIDLLPKDPNTKFSTYEEAKQVIKMDLANKTHGTIKDRDEWKRIKKELELKRSDLVIRYAKQISIGRFFRKSKREELLSILTKRL